MERINSAIYGRIHRWMDIAVGIAAIVFGIAGVIVMVDELRKPPRPGAIQSAWLVELAIIALAVALALIGGRMLRGPAYGDSKLLPSAGLYLGALIFGPPSIGMCFWLSQWAELLSVKIAIVVILSFYVPAMLACIYLAERRRRLGPERIAKPSQWN